MFALFAILILKFSYFIAVDFPCLFKKILIFLYSILNMTDSPDVEGPPSKKIL